MFGDAKISTMTVLFDFNEEIDIPTISTLLPRGWNKKHQHDSGTLISTITRGKKSFLNALTNRLWLENNTHVCIKLSKTGIHMTGSKSKEMSTRSAHLVLDNLFRLKEQIDVVKSYLPEFEETVKTIVSAGMGPVQEETGLHLLNPDVHSILHSQFGDKPYDEFISQQCKKILVYEKICDYFNGLLERIKQETYNFIPLGTNIGPFASAMVNVNYKLGFKILRCQFTRNMDGVDGFNVVYINIYHRGPKVCLPYKNKKGKQATHTILVTKSGSVIQSGPNLETMEEVYNRFMNALMRVKDKVIDN